VLLGIRNFLAAQKIISLLKKKWFQFFQAIIAGFDIDRSRHLGKAKQSRHHHDAYVAMAKIVTTMRSCQLLFQKALISFKEASWEHANLADYHEKVAKDRCLNKPVSYMIRVTMERVKVFRHNSKFYVKKGETLFDNVETQMIEALTTSMVATREDNRRRLLKMQNKDLNNESQTERDLKRSEKIEKYKSAMEKNNGDDEEEKNKELIEKNIIQPIITKLPDFQSTFKIPNFETKNIKFNLKIEPLMEKRISPDLFTQ
jgi:hypothetical protein